MLEPRLKLAVDREKYHPEKCGKGVCAVVLNVPSAFGSKGTIGFALCDSVLA